jgi:predicted MFS family arabinose efflux permease
LEKLQQTIAAKGATKAIFLVCGIGISSWAPMVPYAKERLALNDADLGLLLLLLGGGAIAMMPITGILSHKFGSRIVMLWSAIFIALILPLLLFITSNMWMGVALFAFGAAIGTIDVAMNAHAVQVQNKYGKPIMSSFHGLFSVGGLLGSLGLGFLIKLGLDPFYAIISISAVLLFIAIWKYRDLFTFYMEKEVMAEFTSKQSEGPVKKFSWLTGSLLFLGLMCFAVFLSEGSMLDWSAVFLRESRGVDPELAGIGYAAFSIAMAVMRLVGDKIILKLDGRLVVIGGSVLASAGLFIVVFSTWLPILLFGFVLLGIGAANIVPIFFSEAGRLKNVPASVAIPVVSVMGYTGQLAGPALLGFIAYHYSLDVAMGFTASLLLLVGVSYFVAMSIVPPFLKRS